jgi:hypothetical protein
VDKHARQRQPGVSDHKRPGIGITPAKPWSKSCSLSRRGASEMDEPSEFQCRVSFTLWATSSAKPIKNTARRAVSRFSQLAIMGFAIEPWK